MDFFSKIEMVSQFTPMEQAVILVLLVWSLIWKGIALWRSAKRDEKKWFIALLVVNTVGILDILYLYVFLKQENKSEASAQ